MTEEHDGGSSQLLCQKHCRGLWMHVNDDYVCVCVFPYAVHSFCDLAPALGVHTVWPLSVVDWLSSVPVSAGAGSWPGGCRLIMTA